MATKDKGEDLDLDAKKPGNKKLLILYIIIGLLVVGMGTVTALLLMGGEGQPSPEAAVAFKEPNYLPLEKLTVNFSARGPARFLQVDIQAMSTDKAALKAIETHMPIIRNDILLLLGTQSFEEISTRAGKEKLRTDVQDTINRILAERTPPGKDGQVSPPVIEAVYFTNFVMQ